jgi:hypothetical protein
MNVLFRPGLQARNQPPIGSAMLPYRRRAAPI